MLGVRPMNRLIQGSIYSRFAFRFRFFFQVRAVRVLLLLHKLTVCIVAIGATMLATLEVVIWDGMATI